MLFYLGNKVEEPVVTEVIRKNRNKAKSWKYGYDESIDVIIISKDGTLGEVYYVNGIKIGFPQKPDHKEIINWDKSHSNQKWQREEILEGLNEDTQFQNKYIDFIESQFKKREEGIWIYLNGKAVYMTGTYWFFLSWYKEEDDYPTLRIIQNELMLFWEACKADPRCYGIIYLKNRRFGWSALCNNEKLEVGTKTENKLLGMISKKGNDAKKLFKRLVTAFKRLPVFFQPEVDGQTTPKTELIFSEPSKKRKKDEKIKEDGGLDTSIAWANTEPNAFDGDKMYRISGDETGKWPKDCLFSQWWGVAKTCLRLGSRIVGKAMIGSTVNAMLKGGGEFKKIWDLSSPLDRNQNGQTKSGLYSLFIDAAYCIEGFFDVFGFSVADDPAQAFTNELGEIKKIGAATYLKNELDSLKDDPEAYNEQLRQFPRTERDAFRPDATDCAFNLVKILEQIEYNSDTLNETWNNNIPNGNTEIERGNFSWKDGIKDSEVIWNPAPEGRFWIAKDCHPPKEYRNKREKKMINGVLAFAPMAGHVYCMGIDPYNVTKSADNRGSFGSTLIRTKLNTTALPNNSYILEYVDRAKTVKLFFEDMIMCAVYYSVPFLCELSNYQFLDLVKERGYRHFSMNNPFKMFKDLTPAEKEFGGTPAQNVQIGEQQFTAIQSDIEDLIGYANDESNRDLGKMGYMPFTRTLVQWKDFEPAKRTKYDAFIASSLASVACQKRDFTPPPPPSASLSIFETYNNDNLYSQRQ